MPPLLKKKPIQTRKPKANNGREIIYPEVSIKLCNGERDPFLTADEAKLLLGWEPETDDCKFGAEFTLLDGYGTKVRCLNNMGNRPYKPTNASLIRQEVLCGKWRLNLESMIVGKTGLLISCQHRLIGLILAVQEWEQHQAKWKKFWKTEPTLACLIAFGCDEQDEVVNTIDTGEPRSLADVIYRGGYFREGGLNNAQRERVSKILEYAVKFLWQRTGAFLNPYSGLRTHSESLDFIERHERILEAAKFVYEEDGGKHRKITTLMPSGIACGLLYLMGAATSNQDEYKELTPPNESVIDWEQWDQACDFWEKLASNHKDLLLLHTKLVEMRNEASSNPEKVALIIKAWAQFVAKKELTEKGVSLRYRFDGEFKHLEEFPVLGGIDRGDRRHKSSQEEES